MIGFSEDGNEFRVRQTYKEPVKILGNILYSKWDPWNDVSVETWIIPQKQSRWHVRVHRIFSATKALQSIEGGFSINRYDYNVDSHVADSETAVAETISDISGVVQLSLGSSPTIKRTPKVHAPEGDVNLHFARTWVPQLRGDIPVGKQVVVGIAVFAGPKHAQQAWKAKSYQVPTLEELENVKKLGQVIGLYRD
jgi:hypothetical protein